MLKSKTLTSPIPSSQSVCVSTHHCDFRTPAIKGTPEVSRQKKWMGHIQRTVNPMASEFSAAMKAASV